MPNKRIDERKKHFSTGEPNFRRVAQLDATILVLPVVCAAGHKNCVILLSIQLKLLVPITKGITVTKLT